MDLRLWLWLIVTFISLRFTVTRRLKNHNSRRGLWAEVQSEMVPYTDDKAILKCLTSSSASIEWLFNGDLISDTDQRFTNEKHKLFVHFKKVPASKWSDNPFKSHKFQCKATLNEETVISEPAKLIITFLDDFDHQNNSVIKTVQGNTAVIPCKPPNSMPSAIMEYYFNQTLISKSEGRYLLNSGNLQILDSQISDSGLYRCVAFNAFLRERRNASWTVELNVQPHSWSKHDAHQSVSFNNDYSAKNSVNFVIKPVNVTKAVMGSNVTLECVADAIKTPKITWFKKRNGVEESLNKKKSRQIAGNLILIAVEENDSGVYVCRATVDNSAIEAHAFVDVQMTPRFIKSLKDTTVNEGEDFTLECQAKGNPNPRINWFFNGKSLNSFKGEPINFNFGLDSESQSIGISFSDGSSKLSIKAASSSIHSGIYQCFASNELLASDYRSISALARVKVLRPGEVNIPKSNSYGNSARSTDSSNANMNSGNEDDLQLATIRPSESGKKRHNELMIPPSKPKIFRLSDDSVMVNWEISSKPSLEVRFFKIQYKVKKSRWNTLPEDIPPYIRSQTVTGLVPDAKYRFRVLAVYVNDDNKESPSSDKFHLIRTSMLKKPKDPPTINAVLPQSHTSIEVFWENHRENATSLEGFFIHYRATSSAGEYFQITVLGSNKLSYTVSNLSPSTSYEFKLQSFNSAGVSDYSKVLTATTFEDPVSTTTEMTNVIKGLDKGLDTRIDNNSDMFLIIVGCIGGFALTVFLVCCLIQCGNRFKQTPQRKKDSQLPQRVNGEINNGSLLHHTTQSIDNYKSETDTLSSHPDKSSINNVTASVSIDHFPIYHEEIRDKKNYQTRTYTIGNYCEDTYTARTGSWSRKSHKKCYEAEAGLKLITTASSHNSLQRKYLYENENLPSTLEKRHQAFKSEEHLKCSLNARIHSKSSSFTKLDGTLERKKRRTATPVATPQPPPIPERQLTVASHRSLSSSRLNGSLEKRKKSRPDYGNTNTNKNGNKSNESKMNSYNGAISHLNTKPPLLIMQSTC